MRKIFQDRFAYGEGNCVWACISSLFDFELDDLRYPPPSDMDLFEWTKREMPHLTFHNVSYMTNYRLVDGYPDVPGLGTARWTYDLRPEADRVKPTVDFWVASVNSLQLKTPVENAYYPTPALHAVVMKGDKLWHDPNPKNPREYEPVVVGASWWEPNVESNAGRHS